MTSLLFTEQNDTIVALSTPAGIGALAVLRLSGTKAVSICNRIFNGTDLEKQATNTLHFGTIRNGEKLLDEVVVSLFLKPHSYTGEDTIEISCHGSPFIVQEIIKTLVKNGARPARPGEFTMRAFMNGKKDLVQAESVADIIAADSEAAHRTAIRQLRGGFSKELKILREKLIEFTSLVELELDFSAEDVEFADRSALKNLIQEILHKVNGLTESFSLGNVLKKGIPVVIAGKPNAGKSTLLNLILNEEKAIVSHIPGTTRDSIEDVVHINGIPFRFIDTAGICEAAEEIEALGVNRTFKNIEKSSLILYVFDISATTKVELSKEIESIRKVTDNDIPVLYIGNKTDKAGHHSPQGEKENLNFSSFVPLIKISAKDDSKREENFKRLSSEIEKLIQVGKLKESRHVLVNARHYEALMKVGFALENAKTGLEKNLSGDLLSTEIRQALHYLGELTGEITNEEVLGAIFSKFCVGK